MYRHICDKNNCEFYVVWDFGYEDCFSCTKIGQSYGVYSYPSDCPSIHEMIKEDPNKVNMISQGKEEPE